MPHPQPHEPCFAIRCVISFEDNSAGDDNRDGDEVFSLMRRSELAPGDYLNRFFDTGHELQRHVE